MSTLFTIGSTHARTLSHDCIHQNDQFHKWHKLNGMECAIYLELCAAQSSSDIHSRRTRESTLTIQTKLSLMVLPLQSIRCVCLLVFFFRFRDVSCWRRLFLLAAWVKWIIVVPPLQPYSIRVTLLIRNNSRLLHWFVFLSFRLFSWKHRFSPDSYLYPFSCSTSLAHLCYAMSSFSALRCATLCGWILIAYFPKN